MSLLSLALGLLAVGPGPRGFDGPSAVVSPTGDSTPASSPADGPPRPLVAAPSPTPTPAPTATSKNTGPDGRRKVRVKTSPTLTDADRSGSIVTRQELDERLPRSAPDALTFEPGVFVQQTAHGQASPYIRGLTGQQTAIFFDGVRLNNSTFRQGPNQYFFTVDSRTIQSIEVVRGSSSTRYGSDAMGGAIVASPIEPTLERTDRLVHTKGRASFVTRTADATLGGRAQLDIGLRDKLGIIGGVGYRDVNQLRAGGRVTAPATGMPQNVPPLFGPDGKTQLGTGFRELTGDARLVYAPNQRYRITLGHYDYKQYDAPRTDKCPPPTAPQDECLTYLQQFRRLTYLKFAASHAAIMADAVSWTISYQHSHENRYLRRGSPSPTRLGGIDDVDSVGTRLEISTAELRPNKTVGFVVRYGADAYFDHISSKASQTFVDTDTTIDSPFTQYTDGARYFTSGAWAVLETHLGRYVRVRSGGRLAAVTAKAKAVEERASEAVDRYWLTAVAHGGVTVSPLRWLDIVGNVDQGFRAPNLDDLTSRQQIGSGYQRENPRLRHERSTMIEGGVKLRHPWIEFDAFVFKTYLDHYIQRASVSISECPSGDPGCNSSKSRFQLVNLDGYAHVFGADGGVRVFLPKSFFLTATLSYARGEGPNPDYPKVPDQPPVAPLSRIPPFHGTGELGWRSRRLGLYVVGAVRWAREQRRLATQDRKDLRIPDGGTPGFVVVDLRAGWRLDPHVLLAMVFENVADTAYRIHGSSVNGAGRGLMLEAQFGF